LFSPHHPKIVISTEGGALCRRSGEICCCLCRCLFSFRHPLNVISTEGGALCRRSGEICCCFAIVVVCSSRPVTHKPVISTEGGASAAAAEKSAVAVAVACTPDTTQEVISTEGGVSAAAVEKSAVVVAFIQSFLSGHRYSSTAPSHCNDKSSQVGFSRSIKATFFSRRHRLICFSRAIPAEAVENR